MRRPLPARSLSSLALAGVLLAVPCLAAANGDAPPAGQKPGPSKGLIPQVKPASKDDFDFRPGPMQLVTDAPTGQRYWVFTYTIINRSGKTQRFSPRFELLLGGGTILSAGEGVRPEVSRRLQRQVAKPEAADQFQIMGDILDGEANAREGFVIWPANVDGTDAKDMTFFVTGLSPVFERVKDPATGKETMRRRTWTRTYSVPGVPDPLVSTEATFDAVKDTWIMR